MKTCLILEIKNGMATVLYPDGKIADVKAKKSWQVGQTVSPAKGSQKVKPMFVAVACLLFVFVVVTSFTGNLGNNTVIDTLGTADTADSEPLVEPEVIASKLEAADDDFENIYEAISETETIREYSSYNLVPESSDLPEETALGSGGSSSGEQQAEDNASNYDIADGKGSDGGEYSETNNQVKGVQEADIIKTDGKYIYALNSKNLVILEANDGKPKELFKIKQKESDGLFFEMYIEGNKLILIKNTVKTADTGEDRIMTKAVFYDITDPSKPEKINALSQSGEYRDSRMVDGYVYIVTGHEIKPSFLEKNQLDSYVPETDNGKETTVMSPDSVVMCPVDYYPTYTVVGSIDTDDPTDYKNTRSILGGASDVYSSKNNIYITSLADEPAQNSVKGMTVEGYTQVAKIGFADGKLEAPVSAIVPGTTIDQFSMDEHNGDFRMVNHVYWYSHSNYSDGFYTALFVLDDNLKEKGKIVNIAPGEDLYSCRFMEDYVYFVTFKQVDPLFTADLSDPENPKLVGELKIPGFSEYLHPYSEGLLLGVGSDADEDSGNVGDLKLSMFDNSDPANVKEKHTLIVKGYDYTEVSENHKAILVDSKKKLIAFPSHNTYLVYTYDKKSGFTEVGKMRYEDDYDYEYTENIIRGMYIDDFFYVITPNTVKTFDMNNKFKVKSTLKINNGAEPVSQYTYVYEYWEDGGDDIIIYD